MPLHAEFVTQQLARLSSERAVKIQSHTAWIKCPFHDQGHEGTASLVINLDNEKGFRPGSWRCFACGKFGQWNEFAKGVGLKRRRGSIADDFLLEVPDALRHELLTEEIIDLPLDAQQGLPWPVHERWRGMAGKLVNAVGGLDIATQYGRRLYLPIYINRQFYGGIVCTLSDRSKRKYIFDKNLPIEQLLYPYDYVRQQLRQQQRTHKKYRRIIFLVEGVRDALNLIQHGLLAVCILGGFTVWSAAKAKLLMTLEPDLLVLAFDPDKVGRKLTKIAYADLQGEFPIKQLRLPRRRRGKTKHDPGNLSARRIARIRQRLSL